MFAPSESLPKFYEFRAKPFWANPNFQLQEPKRSYRGQNVRFPVFPRNLTFTEGNQQTCLLSRSGKCQNNVNFPILVREIIEIKYLFSLVVIHNTTENLISFRNIVFTGRGHLDYDVRP